VAQQLRQCLRFGLGDERASWELYCGRSEHWVQKMKRPCAYLSIGGTAGVVIIVLLLSDSLRPSKSPARSPASPAAPQCGHFAIMRVCELLGMPLDMPTILDLMPPHDDGNSLYEIAETLHSLGFTTDARRATFTTLASEEFPLIVHFREPDHFAVAFGMDREVVRLFDGSGAHASMPARRFKDKWTGAILSVRRNSFTSEAGGFASPGGCRPRIAFESLIADCGVVSSSDSEVRTEYRFVNKGSCDLEITSVSTSCTCLEVQRPTSVTRPGDDGYIRVTYRPNKSGGSFIQEVFVRTNDPEMPLVRLKAIGHTDAGVRIRPSQVSLEQIVSGPRITRAVFVTYSGLHEPFLIEDAKCTIPGVAIRWYSLGDQEIPGEWWLGPHESFRAGRSGFVLEFSVQDRSEVGTLHGEVLVKTSIPGSGTLTLPAHVSFVPPVVAQPSALVVDGRQRGSAGKGRLWIESRTSERFTISDVVGRGDLEGVYSIAIGDEARSSASRVPVDFSLNEVVSQPFLDDVVAIEVLMESKLRFLVPIDLVIRGNTVEEVP
jgi:hypothetical protein